MCWSEFAVAEYSQLEFRRKVFESFLEDLLGAEGSRDVHRKNSSLSWLLRPGATIHRADLRDSAWPIRAKFPWSAHRVAWER